MCTIGRDVSAYILVCKFGEKNWDKKCALVPSGGG